MDYGDMRFTENDKKRLLENRDAICAWIMENIVPAIDDDESVRVDYGGTYRCPRSGTPTEMYHFVVYGKKNHFYFMGDKGTGYIGYGEKFGGCHEPFEKAYSPYDIYPVVDNWKMIKQVLLSTVEERKRAKKSIYSFEV